MITFFSSFPGQELRKDTQQISELSHEQRCKTPKIWLLSSFNVFQFSLEIWRECVNLQRIEAYNLNNLFFNSNFIVYK